MQTKQKIGIFVLFFSIIGLVGNSFSTQQSWDDYPDWAEEYNPDHAQGIAQTAANYQQEINQMTAEQIEADLITLREQDADVISYMKWLNVVFWLGKAIEYIVKAQLDSVDVIAMTPMSGSGMFDNIIWALTILAAIGCFIKLINHFLATEKFDNVKAFTGFFSYFGMLILFIFSSQLINFMVDLNTDINTNNISQIGTQLIEELDRVQLEDLKGLSVELAQIREEQAGSSLVRSVLLDIKINGKVMATGLSNLLAYVYYSVFGLVLTSVIAIPVVIMTLMVKVTLSIMVLGAKIVFLMAFIPGFENTWKTYMQNLLNVLLWIPIFNIIITFIIAIVAGTIQPDVLGTGQIIWLSIIAFIMATKSISLTTTAASTIVNGSAAGMAGAMGSMAAMNATTLVAGTAAMAAGGAALGAKAMAAKAAASKFSKK